MSEDISALEAEYCPPLDPALFSAIISDFDLSQNGASQNAREILDSLRATAITDEETSFDPSGAGAITNDRSEAGAPSLTSHSDHTESSSLSSGIHSLCLNDTGASADDAATFSSFLKDVETLDHPTKVLMLKEMFPDTNEYTISFILEKCKSNCERAIEELLNHTFLDRDGLMDGEWKASAKGIEAFSEDNIARRLRRKKDKRRFRSEDDNYPRSSSLPGTPVDIGDNPWNAGAKDIEFITTRTKIPTATVTSIYHQNGASLPKTITVLLNSTAISSTNIAPSSTSIIRTHATELGKDFPSISRGHLLQLIRLTHPSTAAAHELARALTKPRPSSSAGGLQVITRYKPLQTSSNNTSDAEDDWEECHSRSALSYPATPVSPANSTALAASYSAAANRAYSQASAVYRRGRSDKLMGGAAAYYSQLGRDFATQRVEASSDAADALVATQSSATWVDLHGVSVKDAVRIARQKAESWYRAGGGRGVLGLDGRVVQERDQRPGKTGLTLVTGVGRHSEGGRAKIGPAVGRMLVQEGWKFVAAEGRLTITGKNK